MLHGLNRVVVRCIRWIENMCKFYEPQVTTCKYVIFEVIINIFPSFTDTVKHNSYHLIFLNATFMFHLYKYQTYKTLSRRAKAILYSLTGGGTFYILSLTQFVLTHMCFTDYAPHPSLPAFLYNIKVKTFDSRFLHFNTLYLPRGQWTNWRQKLRKTNYFVLKRSATFRGISPCPASRLPGRLVTAAQLSSRLNPNIEIYVGMW